MKSRKVTCPCCSDDCIERSWYEEVGLVETDIKCKCGYHYSDSYGRVEITLPNNRQWEFDYTISEEDYDEIDLEIQNAIKAINS